MSPPAASDPGPPPGGPTAGAAVGPPSAPASGRRPGDVAAWVLATWFGCGKVPRAPGTAGTLGALPLYFVVAPGGPWAIALAALLVTLVGVAAASRVCRLTGRHDPQVVCIDEVAGVLLVLAAAPPTWWGVALGVVLFRVLDITKPWPARAAERLPAGWGVMMDDVLAGLWGALSLFAARAFGLG